MKKVFTIIAAASMFAACDQNQTNRDVAKDADFSLNGKMMAQHALMIEREDALQAQKDQALTASLAATSTPKPAATKSRTTRHNRYSGSSNATTYSSSAERNDAGIIQAPAKKKGWSKAAKGAVIGGVTGAAAGAIISKNKGKGAIIGGIIGAGGGYVIGRSKDKKDGRY